LQNWIKARKPQEQRFIDCYNDYMRIPSDGDTSGTGTPRSRQAKNIFIGSTRNKVRAARAKILDSLFGANRMPFDTEPANENIKQFSDVMEDILNEQFEEMEYQSLIRDGVDEIAVNGTAFIFGPFVETKTKKLVRQAINKMTGRPELQQVEYQYPCPVFEIARTIGVYPDPAAITEQKGRGVYWDEWLAVDDVRALKDDSRYKNIDDALKIQGETYLTEGQVHLEQARANMDYWFDRNSGRIRVARYFGLVESDYLEDDEEAEESSGESDDEEAKENHVEVMAIIAGGVCIRCEKSVWEKRPVYRCVYEKVPHEMYGVGIGENNATAQKITNAAFRLFMEGKGHALMPQRSIDKSLFLPTEDFKAAPGKTYHLKPNLTKEQRETAIMWHANLDVSDGWRDVIAMAEQYSDDETAITKYTQGDDSGHMNKTASGISMIMGASALPLKEVIQNIDTMWIEEHVEALIRWNLEFLEVEHVKNMLDEEKAAIWAEIKNFGQSNFMKWRAIGAATMMAKEVLLNKLNGFLQIVGSNPALAANVDMRELLEQIWDATQTGRESPILKDEDLTPDALPEPVKKMLGDAQMQSQQAQEQIQQMEQVMRQMDEEIQKKDDAMKKMGFQLESSALDAKKVALQSQINQASQEGDMSKVAELEAQYAIEEMKQKLQTEREIALKEIEVKGNFDVANPMAAPESPVNLLLNTVQQGQSEMAEALVMLAQTQAQMVAQLQQQNDIAKAPKTTQMQGADGKIRTAITQPQIQ
jgi:hypothetical protein